MHLTFTIEYLSLVSIFIANKKVIGHLMHLNNKTRYYCIVERKVGLMKNKLNTLTKGLQVDILTNFGNTAYQRLSKDFYLDNIPAELYEVWYKANELSFSDLVDINRIKYLSYNELSEYYSQLTILKNKLEIIFNDISIQQLNIPLQVVIKDKNNLLHKIFYVIKGGN